MIKVFNVDFFYRFIYSKGNWLCLLKLHSWLIGENVKLNIVITLGFTPYKIVKSDDKWVRNTHIIIIYNMIIFPFTFLKYSIFGGFKIQPMKVLIFFLLFLFSGNTDQEYHLIFTGKYSKSYHKDYDKPSQYCRGLKDCRAEIQRLPVDEAKRLRPDPCDYCFVH